MPASAPLPAPDALLRGRGLRVTRQRVAVLDALQTAPHSRADVVISAVREDMVVSTQAVYDVLNTLTERGLLRRFQPAGSAARYELQSGDNHHHVVCRSCETVTDVECARGAAPCLDLPSTTELHGFTVDEAEVTWWGSCPACASTTPEPDPLRRDDD